MRESADEGVSTVVGIQVMPDSSHWSGKESVTSLTLSFKTGLFSIVRSQTYPDSNIVDIKARSICSVYYDRIWVRFGIFCTHYLNSDKKWEFW